MNKDIYRLITLFFWLAFLVLMNSSAHASDNSSKVESFLNLANISYMLGIVISVSAIIGFGIQLIIDAKVKAEIDRRIERHAQSWGHEKLIDRIARLERKIEGIQIHTGMELNSGFLTEK